MVLKKTVVSPLDCKEIQPKGNQSWVFTGRTDVEAETPILWLLDAKSTLTGKDPDTGKEWGWEENGTTEDEMVGWHHWLNGHGFGWIPGGGDGQGGLMCCGSWGHKQLDITEQLNWTDAGKGLPTLLIPQILGFYSNILLREASPPTLPPYQRPLLCSSPQYIYHLLTCHMLISSSYLSSFTNASILKAEICVSFVLVFTAGLE